MKFLIIGASGFVGNHILLHIKSLGYDALGTQSKSKYTNLITFDLLQDRIKNRIPTSFFNTDETIFGVICASISQIDRCFKERKISHVANVENTIRLIQDLNVLGVKPVFISTSYVFDGKIGSYNEKYPSSPSNEYGRHKLEVENFITENAPETLVLRLDKIVGSNPMEHHLFSEWYQLIKKKQPLLVIKDQIISPTYVEDVAKAILLSCKKNLTGLYHVANTEFISREELARKFVIACGGGSDVIAKPQEEFDFLDCRPLKSYLDVTKFRKKTGMKFTTIKNMFADFIRQANNHET